MRIPLNRGAAIVQSGLAFLQWHEGADFRGFGVIKTEAHRTRLLDMARQSTTEDDRARQRTAQPRNGA
ncbi:hypothetical protein GCM10027402_36170 [Arthrobacter monumenti]